MDNKTVCIVLIFVITLGMRIAAYSQSEFDDAHALLQKLEDERVAPRSADQTKRLGEEERSAPSHVEQFLNAGILKYLNTSTVLSPQNLQDRLQAALQIGPEQPEPGINAEAFVFPSGSPKREYLVAYNIPYCVACSHSWIGVIGQEDDHYKILASLENSLPNQTLKVVPLWIGDGGTRFLAYGTNWGDAHNRLNIVAYVLDGNQISSFWSRTGLSEGTVEFNRGTMVLSFLTSLQPPWKRRTENYSLGKEEIRFQSATEAPEDSKRSALSDGQRRGKLACNERTIHSIRLAQI